MFDQLSQELEQAIDEIVDAQNGLQQEADALESELKAANDFYQQSVLDHPGRDHSETEKGILAIEHKLVRMAKRLAAFPVGHPNRGSVAARIASKQSNGLRKKAIEALEVGKAEIEAQQALIAQIMDKKLPEMREILINLASECGKAERRKAEIVQGMDFIKICAPDSPLSRFRARPAVGWGQLECFDESLSSEYDAAR